jgi:predicted signal transduction protein with EAL and GGDEF domain
MSIDIDISIGVNVVDPDSSDPETILLQSNLAMGQAKSQQHARVAVFDVATAKDGYDDYQLYSDLKEALRQGGLSIAFQPLVDSDQSLRGVEALARWRHPSEGFIGPDVFLDIAERYRMMRELGEHLFQLSLDGFLALDGIRIPFASSLEHPDSSHCHPLALGSSTHPHLPYDLPRS